MSKRRYFDKLATGWDKIYHRDNLLAIEALIKRFKIKKGSMVLDVGSGTGVLLPCLLKNVGSKGEVLALDFSLTMIKKARSKDENKKVNFTNADAEAIPIKKDLFDYVICFACFPHIFDKRKALIEMSRVLKKGGKLFIAHLLSSEEIKIHHRQFAGEVSKDTLPQEKTMQRWMIKAGLKGIRIIDKPSLYLAAGVKR
jgi:ubiquinone/menaquinone biosynthesis C-methylase UbiE